MVFGLIPSLLLLILVFISGIVLTGVYYKGPNAKLIMGILIGLGFVFVVIGVIFIGCMASMSKI